MESKWSEENSKPLLLEDLPAETLKRNVSNVLEVLSKNRYQNFPSAKLVAVTKTVSDKVVNQFVKLEILDIAENRVQVALNKLPKIAPEFRVHWIGRLQTNKVKYIIDKVCLLHTLDRIPLAEEIERQGDKHGIILPCLVQVNIAQEPQKAGLSLDEVRPFLQKMRNYQNLSIKGLMSMMPLTSDEQALTQWFRGMRTLFEQLREEAPESAAMEELSMGMSNDYPIAAREGATMVRVGTALYRA